MPDDPQNVMQIKSQILELHQIVDIIYSEWTLVKILIGRKLNL